MLLLTRKEGESILIGDDIKITVIEVTGDRVRLGIEAPRDLSVYREEVYLAIREENRQAARSSDVKELLESFRKGEE